MTIGAAMAGGAVAMQAASSYASYRGARDASQVAQQAGAIKDQQLDTQLATTALQSRQQEVERQRQAEITQSAGIAGAGAAGIDYWASPTGATLDAANTQAAKADIENIQLMGAAGQNRLLLEKRGNALDMSVAKTAGSSAWIKPTISLLGSAFKAGRSMDFGGGGDANPSGGYGTQSGAMDNSGGVYSQRRGG
jgi:hypothetical protein